MPTLVWKTGEVFPCISPEGARITSPTNGIVYLVLTQPICFFKGWYDLSHAVMRYLSSPIPIPASKATYLRTPPQYTDGPCTPQREA